MPLPNYGYFNQETKKHQEIKFDMPPTLADDPGANLGSNGFRTGAKESTSQHNKRGQVTTGKIDIDLERKLVIHADRDKEIWTPPKIDENQISEAKKFAAPERKDFRRQVRSSIDSLISGRKARELREEDNDKPSDLTFLLDSSSQDSSFPTSPVRRTFPSTLPDTSSSKRETPGSSFGESYGTGTTSKSFGSYADTDDDTLLPYSPKSQFGLNSHRSQVASFSSTSYSSSSMYTNASDTMENKYGGPKPSETSRTFVQRRSNGLSSSERIIPVRRQ